MWCVFEHGLFCVQLRTALEDFSVFGWGFGLSEGGPFRSGVGGVSSKAAASIFVSNIAVPSRPPRSFWISQTYRPPSPPPSLSRPHLANDDAHALHTIMARLRLLGEHECAMRPKRFCVIDGYKLE